LNSSIGALIGLTGTPKLNNEDDTYVSTRFRNENTSKFVIGTLWNTFALVNNLFLQRPRKRRNALSGEVNLQADQLAHLQRLYSLAERDQADERPTTNLESIVAESLLESSSINPTNHLQSVISDILSSKKDAHCTCYGNHHIPSCIYYDHSLPYLPNSDNISQIEKILSDIQNSSKSSYQDAATQSYIEKPQRTFTHFKPTNDISTQLHNHASTQYSPIGDKNSISTQFNSTEIPNNIDVSTQTIENNLNNISTKSNLDEISKPMNITTQSIPKIIEDNHIHDRRSSLMNELKQVISSSSPKDTIKSKQNLDEKPPPPPPSHTVRSLVSMFETTNQSNLLFQRKPITNNSNVLTPPDSTLLDIVTEEAHASIVPDPIEQYANEIASNIVDNAVVTATTTTVCYDEQQERRFSFYNNGGGHGKSLLFRSNTFVPSTDILTQETEQHFRGILNQFSA
jgi:hypothetical protein